MTRRDFWLAATVLTLVLALVFQFMEADRLKDQLEDSRRESAAEVGRLTLNIKSLNKQNDDFLAANVQLAGRVQKLAEANGLLAAQVSDLRKSAAQAAGQVSSLPPTEIARQIGDLTGASPGDVTSQSSGAVLLSAPAAQKNLVTLILWKADHDSAGRYDQIVENLRAQTVAQEEEIENLKRVVDNKYKEVEDEKAKADAEAKPLKAEIALLKARSRKRALVTAILCTAGGIVIKALFL